MPLSIHPYPPEMTADMGIFLSKLMALCIPRKFWLTICFGMMGIPVQKQHRITRHIFGKVWGMVHQHALNWIHSLFASIAVQSVSGLTRKAFNCAVLSISFVFL